ncbi:MAG: choice-of-anchor D domain-containing protein [Ignavibacteriota bacterium]
MKSWIKGVLLLAFAGGPAWGQFQLFLVNGSIAQPVVRTYDLGNVAPGTSAAVPFRITNVSSTSAMLNLLTVTGSGFSVAAAKAPVLPVSLAPQQSVDFTVAFQAGAAGSYSGALTSTGIAIALTATVPAQLTYQWVTGAGVKALSAGPVDFGSVPVGQSPTIEILMLNQTISPLPVPAASVSGAGFSLISQPTAGTVVKPAASAALEIQFRPAAEGTANGTLTLGGQSFALTGAGIIPALPLPSLVLTLTQAGSAQQGTVAVNLSAISQTSTTGTVRLSFVPDPSTHATSDPGIAFASGGQSATFNVFIGAKQAAFGSANSLPFQTGTTAGTLTVSAALGGATVQQSIAILPAVVGVTAVKGVRSTGTVEVDVTGFDNTRSAGALSFSFFDGAGNLVAAPVQANGSSNFASYFQNSAGGTFQLKAVFPVVGDTSQIASFQATVTNSAGTATVARTNY